MAGGNIKNEPGSSLPAASISSSRNLQAPEPKLVKVMHFSKNAPEKSKYQWQQELGAHEKLKEIIIKEKAAVTGRNFCQQMIVDLKGHEGESVAGPCEFWTEKLQNILNKEQHANVSVGVRGQTGSGKTTIINSLLGMKDLLPTSCNLACTAVCVQISYNWSNEENQRFRAEVEFIALEDWKMELDLLFEDVEAHFLTQGKKNVEADLEREDRIEETLSKLRVVYPHLKNIKDLKNTSASKLLEDTDVLNILSTTRIINRHEQGKFSRLLTRYINSKQSDNHRLPLWPLVKLVRIFVKCDFLATGLTLVDLPGSGDVNAARSAAADKYEQTLSINCIVTEMKRGANDQGAHNLLEDITKGTLQMDGSYDTEHLCFILSQCDRDFDIPYYLKQNPRLRTKLKETRKEASDACSRCLERSKEIEQSRETRSKQLEMIETLEEEIDGLSGTSVNNDGVSSELKRKRGPQESLSAVPSDSRNTQLRKLKHQLADLIRTSNQEDRHLLSLERGKQQLEKARFYAHSRLAAGCMAERNSESIEAVREWFGNTIFEIGKMPSSEPLKVFCVAAVKYLEYKHNRIPQQGFPTIQHTEIPQLRDWMVGFTFTGRARNAGLLLKEIVMLMESMRPWVDDKFGDIKMTPKQREELEPEFEERCQELEQKFNELNSHTANNIEQLIKIGIYAKMPEAEQAAAVKAHKTVVKFARGLHWSTHRAINQRKGEWVKKKEKQKYHWNHKLALDYIECLLSSWDETFMEMIPQQLEAYVETWTQLVAEFAEIATPNMHSSDVTVGFDILKDHIIKSENILQSHVQWISAAITAAKRDAHRRAAPAIQIFLDPIYTACASEGGKGHYQRNKDKHYNTMVERGVAMYQEATEAIKGVLDEMLKELPPRFMAAQKDILARIREEIYLFFDNYTASGSRNSTRKVISPAKIRLQKALAANFNNLIKAWAEDIEFVVEAEEELTEDSFAPGDIFQIEANVGRDEEYKYESDAEDDDC